MKQLKTHILRLESVVKYGVGGPRAGLIDLIFAFLLQEFKLDCYSYIHINQIGEDLNEFVMKEGRSKVYINIRYPVFEDFDLKSPIEQNQIRLDVVYNALLMLAEIDSRFEKNKIDAIKNKILEHDFSFDFVYREFLNKKNNKLLSKILIHPKHDQFDFYIVIEENKEIKCKQLIYSGLTSDYYIKSFFFNGKWNGTNEFIIKPKGEFEIRIIVDQCHFTFINLTGYEKPPLFEMMKAKISVFDKEKAHNDWIHSLPPAIAAIVTHEPN